MNHEIFKMFQTRYHSPIWEKLILRITKKHSFDFFKNRVLNNGKKKSIRWVWFSMLKQISDIWKDGELWKNWWNPGLKLVKIIFMVTRSLLLVKIWDALYTDTWKAEAAAFRKKIQFALTFIVLMIIGAANCKLR